MGTGITDVIGGPHDFLPPMSDEFQKLCDNMIFLGDLNYDLLSVDKGTPLNTVCDICGIENIIKGATCFTKDAPGLTLEGDSGKEVALWLLTSLCTSAKREVEVALLC